MGQPLSRHIVQNLNANNIVQTQIQILIQIDPRGEFCIFCTNKRDDINHMKCLDCRSMRLEKLL